MSTQLKDAMDGGWKRLKDFSVFSQFLNLTEDQKKFQQKKADQFIKLAYEAIKKHFSIWCNDLLFFGLFGEKHSAFTLANYLSQTKTGEQPRNYVVFSEFHLTTINLNNLRDFIDCECRDINMVRESFHIRKVAPLIRELQNGRDIWCSSYQGIWKDIFLRHYSSHATHTQMVESAVKDSNFCSKKGRPEELQTQVGQIRSGILRELNIDARKKQVENKLTKDGKSFKEDNHPVKIRGFHKTETAISKTRSHANLLNEKYVLKKVVWERMKALVTMKYSDERKSRKIAALLDMKDKNREPNAIQRAEGYDETPQMRGEVQLGKLNSHSHLHLLKEECIVRGMAPEEADKIKVTKAKQFIKDADKKRNPNGDDRFFKPLSDAPFDQWYVSS